MVGIAALDLFDGPPDHSVECRRLELGLGACPEARQGQQVLDDLVEALGLGRDVGHHRMTLILCQLIAPILQETGVAEDRGHWRPQLVRHEPQELVLDRIRCLEFGRPRRRGVVPVGRPCSVVIVMSARESLRRPS